MLLIARAPRLDRVLANRGATHFTAMTTRLVVAKSTGNARLIGIDTGLRAFTENSHDLIGNPVAYLVRMAFRNGFIVNSNFRAPSLSPI